MENLQDNVDFEKLEDELFNHPCLSTEREKGLLERIAQGDVEATHELVRHNMRFAGKVAAVHVNRNRNTQLFFDVVSEGIIGLYEAARTYDESKCKRKSSADTGFQTHARSIIRRRILEYLKIAREKVYMPRDGIYQAFKRATNAMQKMGIEVARGNIMEFVENPGSRIGPSTRKKLTGLTEEMLTAYCRMHYARIKRFMAPGEELANANWYVADRSSDERKSPAEKELSERVREAIATLKPEEREAIRMRYLDSQMTQSEIAGIRGVTRQAISDNERNALRKLKYRLSEFRELVA